VESGDAIWEAVGHIEESGAAIAILTEALAILQSHPSFPLPTQELLQRHPERQSKLQQRIAWLEHQTPDIPVHLGSP
jgi:hypothetical protein